MKRPHRTHGFVLYEAMMALALSLTLVVGTAQLLTLTTQQRRLAGEYASAAEEAGNLMEGFAARDWDGTSAEKLAQASLSAEIRRRLPEAKLEVQVADETPQSRRISIQIQWRRLTGQKAASLRLVGWKFREGEGRP